MDASATINPDTVIAGRWRVEKRLGVGGMGEVYLVRHERTGERFALKVLHASFASDAQALERFRREAQAPAQIDSDHVARVVDADVAPELGGAPFLVMELLRGRDLEQEVKTRGRLPPVEVVSYLGQAAWALDKAHGMGIVHRDLKPENLFLAEREDGSICLKVVDFGIAKLQDGAQGAARTATGAVFGTPMYMAPEQAKGDNQRVGPWTDVWALGLIAYKLLTGLDYWSFESLTDLVLKIVVEPMPPPTSVAPWLGAGFEAWFFRCCARLPEQRFRSAGEAVAALGEALRSGASASSRPAPPAPNAGAMSAPPSLAYSATYAAARSGYASAPSVPAAPSAPYPMQVYGHPPVPAPAPAQASSTRTALYVIAGLAALGLVAIVGVVVFAVSLLPAPSARSGAVAAPAPALAGGSDDADGCRRSCSRLADCTHLVDPDCEARCHQSPIFAACARSETSCRGISTCALASTCGGMGPAGTRTCKQTSDCEGACTLAGGDNTACLCACIRAMSPDRATELATHNLCATVHCAEACRKPVNGVACLACYNASCRADAAVCKVR